MHHRGRAGSAAAAAAELIAVVDLAALHRMGEPTEVSDTERAVTRAIASHSCAPSSLPGRVRRGPAWPRSRTGQLPMVVP
jgi:hypothetical protein